MKMMKNVIKTTLALVLSGSTLFAQDVASAKKELDAERYQKAKTDLKALIASKPAEGEAYFQLGLAYLNTDYPDSAKAVFTQGTTAVPDNGLNFVGLGMVDFSANNAAAAKTNFDKALAMVKKKENKTFLYVGRAYMMSDKPDYATALTYLEKAKAINEKDAEVFLAMGDAYRGLNKISEAYSAYRTSFDLNPQLLRAKVELGVINKRARAWKESADEFNEVIKLNPNYGPAYRELAETYNGWANNDPKERDAKVAEALKYYEKYMDLTDRSLDSRMRHADFLILAKQYGPLQQEAQQMSQSSTTNPRIYRYLGYAAFENGNYPQSIQGIKDFMAKVDAKRIIPQDYAYLGRAQLKAGEDSLGFLNLKKAIELDSTNAEYLSDIGKTLYTDKKYDKAAQAYELAVANPASKTKLVDNAYLGRAYYYDYATKLNNKQNPSKDILVKADSVYSYLNRTAPTFAEGYLFRARVARFMDSEENPQGLAVPHLTAYVDVLSKKTDPLTAGEKSGLVEAYNNLGAFYIKTDQAKAKEYFTKTLELEPTNEYATSVIKTLASTN